MIGTIDIKVQAAHPNIPLDRLHTFAGSPASLRIRNVPREIGAWKLTKIYVSYETPDSLVRTIEATLTAGIWVATLPACTTVGTVESGYAVIAEGVTEKGDAIYGYILGRGGVEILAIDTQLVAEIDRWYVHLTASAPTTPNKGDCYFANGTLKMYDGTAWRTCGGGSSAWADITGKPTSFPPSTHTHTMSEVDYGDGRNLGEKISGMDTNIGNLASQMSMVPGAINEGISSDVTHAKSISTGGTSTKLTPDDSGNIDVSSLFSSANTSLVNVINSKTQMENAYGPPYAFTQAGDWSLVRNATAGHYQFHDNTGTYDDFGAYIDSAATTRVTDNNIAKACIIYGLRTNAVASVVGYYHVGDPSKVMQKVDYTGGIKLWDAQQSVMWKLTMENGVLTTTPLGNVNTEIA